MEFAAAHLTFLAAYALASWIVGSWTLGRLRIDAPPTERSAVALILGTGILGQLLYLLGLASLLTAGWILGTLGYVVAVAWATDHSTRPRLAAAARALRAHNGVAVLAALTAAPLVALALYPPTGFDSGTYHLPFAERFLAAGELIFIPDLRFPIFPQLGEMAFVLALATVGDVGAALTQLVPCAAIALLLLAWGRRWERPFGGVVAATLWLGTPLVVRGATQAYVDIQVAAFLALTLFGFERAWRGAHTERSGWLIVSAAACGFGLATKYLALVFCITLAVATVVLTVRQRAPRLALLAAIAFAASAGPSTIRLVATTGSPLFPYYAELFGATVWSPNLGGEVTTDELDSHSLGEIATAQAQRIERNLVDLARLPWDGVWERAGYGYQPPLSPWLILALPCGVAFALSPRDRARTVPHLGIVAGFSVLWLTLPRDPRYLLAVLPSLGLVLGVGVDRLTAGWRAGRTALAVALLLPGPAYAAYLLGRQGPLPTDEPARAIYLASALPGSQLVEQLDLGDRAYLLHLENLLYFGHGRAVGDWFGPWRFARIEPLLADPPALWRELEVGDFDLFILPLHPELAPLVGTPSFRRCFVRDRSAPATTGEIVAFRRTARCDGAPMPAEARAPSSRSPHRG